ncbi:MAG: hypothetical protein NTX14_04510 [Candidatus Nealsonbacteria bacterium]|nr:hypothetical protein [Candidatus Nealsonbacteria bacterium]
MTIVKIHKKGVYYTCDPKGINGIRITGLECNFLVCLGSYMDAFAFNMLVPHLFADCVQAKVESKQIVIQAVRPLIARRDAMDMLLEITVNFPETTKIGTLILEKVSAEIIDNGCFSHLVLDLDGGSYEGEFILSSLDCVARGGKIKIFSVQGKVKRIIASGDADISIRSVVAPALHVEVSGCATVKILYYHGDLDRKEGSVKKLTVIVRENGKAIIAGKEYTKETPEGRALEQPQS